MLVQINGTEENVSTDSLADLIDELGLNKQSLVVEHNERIVRQEQWEQTSLKENDVLELLSFVGGG